MSLMFLCLKAWKVWETPYDTVLGAVLLDLDLLCLSSGMRLWMVWRR